MFEAFQLTDRQAGQIERLRSEVLDGLGRPQKTLPSRWLYDERGSELFEAITKLEEYYLTRTETAILNLHAQEIADFCGKDAVLLEYGAGAGVKTKILLDALETPRLYVPIDLASDFLQLTVARLRRNSPLLEIRPVIADFNNDFEIPAGVPRHGRTAFFPGSTIGNLDEAETLLFLRRLRSHVGARGGAIVGVDLRKDISTLLKAYDDKDGITAAFNLNLLRRINRELGADFSLPRFVHEARWNKSESSVEMHLVSLADQSVAIDGRSFRFAAGESIHTESSRKYDLDAFADLARAEDWAVRAIWTDPAKRFAVFGLKPD